MSNPSSVSVPVLSKQKVLIAPHRLMLRGLMQKMFCLRNRFCANTMPTVIAAGSAGGTTIVTRSSVRRIIRLASQPRSIYAPQPSLSESLFNSSSSPCHDSDATWQEIGRTCGSACKRSKIQSIKQTNTNTAVKTVVTKMLKQQ